MFLKGARAVSTMQYFIAVVWLATPLALDAASADTISARNPLSRHPETIRSSDNRIQCTGLSSAISFCGLDSDLGHAPYMHAAMLPHENLSGIPGNRDAPRPDLLAIFQLALEEFNLLSGLRFYWTRTERYVEKLAVRYKLKGEIFIADPYGRDRHQGKTSQLNPDATVSSAHPTGILALITPETIRWNMGIDPEDLSVFVDLHLNSHLSFSGEFGNENMVGIFIRYSF